jgi:hypothetical protein
MDTRSSIAAKLASVPVLGPYMEFLARNRAFLILWLATFISQIGDWLDELAVIIILNKYYSSGKPRPDQDPAFHLSLHHC